MMPGTVLQIKSEEKESVVHLQTYPFKNKSDRFQIY